MKICLNDGLYPNLSMCCGIDTQINDTLVQQFFFKTCKSFEAVQ
jgi:hypothetical protein